MRCKAVVAAAAVAAAIAVFGVLVSISKGGEKRPIVRAPKRNAVELTVYSQDFALVKEVRPVSVNKGRSRLSFTDVSKQLDPHSILLLWQTTQPPNNLTTLPDLIAHSYDLGVANSLGLLRRYLGKEVELVRYHNGREAGRERGKLLVVEGGEDVVLEVDGKLVVRPKGTLVMDNHAGLVTIPQLSVEVESKKKQKAKLELAYLTRGLRWSADYVAVLSPSPPAPLPVGEGRRGEGNKDTLTLTCWSTVTNRTGIEYPNASITLVAGTPSRAVRAVEAEEAEEKMEAPAGGIWRMDFAAHKRRALRLHEIWGGAPQPVGDFHVYRLKRKATIHPEQLNRLMLLEGQNIPLKKDYSYRAPTQRFYDYGYDYYYDYRGYGQDDPIRGNVQVALTFWNKAEEGLGVPLPRGAIRVYEPDATGSLRYLGAAEIRPTPKNKKINITLAHAFDVFTEYWTLSRKAIGKNKVRKEVKVLVHNERAQPVTVRIVQPFGTRWKIIAQSHKHTKLDAYTAEWKVPVPAGGKSVLKFTVDLSW